MSLIGGSLAIGYCKGYKFASITGRFGGGKTALAYRLAYELLHDHGYRYLLSNCQSVWNSHHDELHPRVVGKSLFLDTVVILDEAGMFLKVASDVDEFLAYLRKINVIMLAPSVLPPPMRAKFFTMQRTFNGMGMGLPIWKYAIRLNLGADKYADSMTWYNPAEIFGVFDSNGMPSDDDGISDLLFYWANEAAKFGGYKPLKRSRNDDRYGNSGSSNAFQVVESIGRLAEDVAEAQASIIDSNDSLAFSFHGRGRRR